MAIIKSGASTDQLTVDTTSKAARVTLYDTLGRALGFQAKATFFCSGSFTPVATPTDLVTIYGSATKTVRVLSIRIGVVNTAAGSQAFNLIKRSSVNTAGTFVAGTAVQADSAKATATATCGHYTANPSVLGTAVGTMNIIKVGSPAVTPASWAGITDAAQWEMIAIVEAGLGLHDVPVLNGVAQGLAINFAAAALVAGQVHHYNIVWIEE